VLQNEIFATKWTQKNDEIILNSKLSRKENYQELKDFLISV
jgi:hypothetical protein